MLEACEDIRADERGGVAAVVLGVQCCAVCAHQTRDSRTGHVAADFLLERAKDGVIEERAALHNDVLTEVVRRVGADNLVQRVLDDGYRQTGGNRIMPAPSFCACLTEEFMNTVQREPRSMGCLANRPSLQNSSME